MIKEKPEDLIKGAWYLTATGSYAQVIGIAMKTITVTMHKDILKARPVLDESNQAEFSREFIKRHWKPWDVINCRVMPKEEK